jgi:hypothetical protein
MTQSKLKRVTDMLKRPQAPPHLRDTYGQPPRFNCARGVCIGRSASTEADPELRAVGDTPHQGRAKVSVLSEFPDCEGLFDQRSGVLHIAATALSDGSVVCERCGILILDRNRLVLPHLKERRAEAQIVFGDSSHGCKRGDDVVQLRELAVMLEGPFLSVAVPQRPIHHENL